MAEFLTFNDIKTPHACRHPLPQQTDGAPDAGSVFYFFTLYFGFLILDFTSSDELFPHFVYWLLTPYTQFWNWAVPWTGKNILHLSYPITVKPNGSGDTTYNYVLQLLWTALALIIALTWAFLDRKRNHYNGLAYWLRIVVRYYLGYMLLVYGSVKVI